MAARIKRKHRFPPSSLSCFVLSTLFVSAVIQSAHSSENVTFYLEDEPIYTSQNGAKPGFLMEIVVEMTKHLDIKPSIAFLPWKRAQELTIRSPNAVIFPLSRTKSRENHYKWLCRIFDVPVMFINKKSENPFNTLSQAFMTRGIGVVRGTPQEEFLAKNNIQHVPVGGKEIYSRLAENKFTAVYSAKPEALYVWQTERYPDLLQYGETLQILPLWIATSKLSNNLEASEWEKALQKVKDSGFFKTTVLKYFGPEYLNE